MTTKRVSSSVAGLILVLLIGLLVWSADVPAVTVPMSGRNAAADFALPDSQGTTIKLSDYKGGVVLLDFWATWCHGCKTEIPWYVEFQKKYRQRGLAAIGVAMDDDGWKSVRPFLKANDLNYPIVVGNEKIAKLFGADALPVTLLIDRQGKVAELHAGMVDKDAFEKDIRSLLDEKPEK